MTYDILATGSGGNCVIINGEIAIDMGIPMKKLRESGYIKGLKLVLLTHEHGDHFNAATVRALHWERPALRWGCCEWMVPRLLDVGIDKRIIDVYDPEIKAFQMYGPSLSIRPERIPHDVPNCCYHFIFHGDRRERLFYATDAGTLDGIEAKNYDLYLLEANHTRAEIEARIAERQARGEFAYETRAAANHLSQEQALDWLARNAGPNSCYEFLHVHQNKEKKNETDL